MGRSIFKIVALLISVVFVVTGCTSTTSGPSTSGTTKVVNVKMVDAMTAQAAVDSNLKKEVAVGYTIDSPFIAINPYGNAPLSAVVIFKTATKVAVNLKVVGHDASADIVNNFPAQIDHVIPVYGLYAGEENTVILTLKDGTKKELKIKTDDVDADYLTAKVITAKKSLMFKGLDFVTPDDKPIAAFDSNGEMRWNLNNVGIAREVRKLKNGRFLIPSFRKDAANTVLGVTEIDLMGKVYSDYIVNGGNHHDAFEMPNGNLLVCSANYTVFEIDRVTGAVLKSFDVNKLIPSDDGASMINNGNWFHNNSVWYDQKSDTVLLSGRRNNSVLGVSYTTGKLKWILGDPEGWNKVDKNLLFKPVGKNFEWQYAQHSAKVTPEGYVFLFDNGRVRAKTTSPEKALTGDNNYSRAVMYKIDVEKMTIEQVWEFGKERGPSWYSVYISNVNYLAKNHYYANSGGLLYDPVKKTYEVDENTSNLPGIQASASVVEILNDKVIFEMVFNKNIYQSVRLSPYSDNINFDLDYVGKVIGELNAEILTEIPNLNATNAKAQGIFQVSAIQDPARVLLTGTWDLGKEPKEAKIVIKPVDQEKYLGKTIDIPKVLVPGKPTTFSSQISTLGLTGQFDVFILADGVLYDPVLRFEVK